MASIAEWIEKIKTAIYGEEVRGAIWQSLDAMNTQVDAINVDSAQIEQNKQDIATNTAAITALNSSLTNLRLTAVIPNTVVEVGDSVSITADARNAHSVYILIGGTWNHSFIAAVFPNNSNTPVIRNLAMYRESFDEFRIESKNTWGLTITNVSNVSLPILVYRIEKSN